MSGSDRLYRAVCDSLGVGVLLVGRNGRIEMFNPGASRLLGLERKAVLRRSFAEVFLANAAFDEFNDAVLAALYDGRVGHQRVVGVAVAGATVRLAVDTAYLLDPDRGAHPSTGAVVAVFSDLSEVERLHAEGARSALDLRARHTALRAAYRSLEERNRALAALVRRGQWVRLAASGGLFALVVGVGAWAWHQSPGPGSGEVSAPVPSALADERLLTVQPTHIASTITVPSSIRPRREVPVNSPVQGRIGAIHVKLGERVALGQPLLELDVAEVRVKRRTAQAAWLRASARVDTLAHWSNSVDVSRARRAVTKARLALEAGNTKLSEVDFLVGRGLAPAARRDAAERDQRNRRLDLDSAEQDLDVVLAKGRADAEVARLELANAAAERERLDRILHNAAITAPVAGVVLRMGEASRQSADALHAGASVDPGDPLVTIGDMEGLSASGRVDEVDVRRIEPGHAVRITGPAFAGITLEGEVVHVSSQASRPSGARRLPSFEIEAVVATLSPEERRSIRLGMSAQMQIVVHEDDGALVVPLRAVDLSTGAARVRVRDAATGEDRFVEVATGTTTVDSVEIRRGLSPGDTVVVP